MKKALLLSAVLLTAISAHAQSFWERESTSQPLAATGVSSISIVDQNVSWLNMVDGTLASNMVRYAKSVDGGTEWTTAAVNLGASNLMIGNIHGISDMVAYASVYPLGSTPGGVWKTIDGGTTWSRQSSAAFSDTDSFTDLVYFWNENDGVAVGDPANGYFEIYTTANGGVNWTRVASSPALIPLNDNEYGIINNFEVNGNTIWVSTALGRILKSTDKGLTWTALQGVAWDFNWVDSWNITFTDQNNGVIQSSDWEYYVTHDGGVTWTVIYPSGAIRNFDIAAVPGMPDTYVAIGEDLVDAVRGSSFSLDGGLSWSATEWNNGNDTDVDGFRIAMLDEDHGFGGGWSVSPTVGGIYKWSGGSLLRLAHLGVSNFKGDKSITVSPNPFLETIQITGKNISRVSVTDILGKQIIDVDYARLDTVSLNLDALTNGMYLVKVENEKGTSVIKVVKQ